MGVPVATINSDAFAPAGQRHAKALGMENLPIVTTPHPMEFALRDEIDERAAKIVDEVVRVLTTPAEELGDEYRGKYTRRNLVRSSVPA